MPDAKIEALRAAGYHVERQGTYDNRMKRLAVLEGRLRWAEEEKDHHEKWLSGILDESRRLQERFNRITVALAASGVEWSVIAELIGDDDTRPLPPAETGQPADKSEGLDDAGPVSCCHSPRHQSSILPPGVDQ